MFRGKRVKKNIDPWNRQATLLAEQKPIYNWVEIEHNEVQKDVSAQHHAICQDFC